MTAYRDGYGAAILLADFPADALPFCMPISNRRDRKIQQLETKLTQKNEVLAELMQEYVQLKKELGEH